MLMSSVCQGLPESDPESDPEGETPEEIQTLLLQQDVSEWLACLNNVSLLHVLLQFLPCKG